MKSTFENLLTLLDNSAYLSRFKAKTKYKELKKDPNIFAQTLVPGGSILFEFSENTEFPYGAFAVINLGGINPLPNQSSKELEQLFINFGFHSTLAETLAQIELFISVLKKTDLFL